MHQYATCAVAETALRTHRQKVKPCLAGHHDRQALIAQSMSFARQVFRPFKHCGTCNIASKMWRGLGRNSVVGKEFSPRLSKSELKVLVGAPKKLVGGYEA